jgi:hemolysin III
MELVMVYDKTQMDHMISSADSNEYFNSISHLIGAILSVTGTTVLIVFSAIEYKWMHLISFAIYGTTLFLAFFSSTLLHFNLLFNKYRRVLGILDHNAIYLLIAGTYTPFCLVILEGALGWSIFAFIY